MKKNLNIVFLIILGIGMITSVTSLVFAEEEEREGNEDDGYEVTSHYYINLDDVSLDYIAPENNESTPNVNIDDINRTMNLNDTSNINTYNNSNGDKLKNLTQNISKLEIKIKKIEKKFNRKKRSNLIVSQNLSKSADLNSVVVEKKREDSFFTSIVSSLLRFLK